MREWQGTAHHVTIVNDGFLWNGETYRSLCSIARAITGTKVEWPPVLWNARGKRQETGDPPLGLASEKFFVAPSIRGNLPNTALRFAYLAPDIVEAIVEGRQPRSLTVRQLLRGIPLGWFDQRAAFQF